MDTRTEGDYSVAVSLDERIRRDRKVYCSEWDAKQIKKFREYARGRPTSHINREQMKLITVQTRNRFSDNICKRVLKALSSRVEFTSWDVADTNVKQFLDELYIRNQLADMQSDVTYATMRDGNHALSLQWLVDDRMAEGGRVTVHRERWWDGETGIFVMKDGDTPRYAVKEFYAWHGEDRKKHRTVYYPDRILRFYETNTGWAYFADPSIDDDGTPGQQSWTKPDGSPLGIPVIHFPNGSDDDMPYGASELDGGMLAFQDQINSLQFDISAAATMTGFQQTWSTGTTLEVDAAGNPKAPAVGPGQHWNATGEGAKFGVIEAGNIASLETAYNLKIRSVCRNSSVPDHFFTGQWPSGEALVRAEVEFVEKIRNFCKSAGNPWASLAHSATEIFNTFAVNQPELNEDSMITAIFTDPARRDVIGLTDMAVKQVDFISKKEQLRMTGRSEAQIKKIQKEREDEAAKAIEANQQSFFSGNPAATGVPLSAADPTKPADPANSAFNA